MDQKSEIKKVENKITDEELDKIYLILWYLNFIKLPITDKKIGKLSEEYGIPSIIFYKKLLQRLYTDKGTPDYYYNKLVELEILSNDATLNNSYMKTLSDLTEANKITDTFRLFDFDDKTIIEYAGSFAKCLKKEAKVNHVHDGQPIPDPELGRPYLDWKVCRYDGCYQKFNSALDLVYHLEQYKCYTPRYHLIHEEIVNFNKLTPEKVMSEKMTKCPAYICADNNCETSEDLIRHFQDLGIYPFWQKGLVIKKNNGTKYFTKIEGAYYEAEECVICCANVPNIICYPCYHRTYCVECYTLTKITKCPVCRANVDKIFPFA